MGLLLSCENCTGTGTESVITFSDRLVQRLADGIEEENGDDEEPYDSDANERRWLDRIKCIDDSHTSAYGLSKDSFNALAKRLEAKFKRMAEMDDGCDRRGVIKCFDKNAECPLKCGPEAKRFESCIDRLRVQQLKERAKEYGKDTDEQC